MRRTSFSPLLHVGKHSRLPPVDPPGRACGPYRSVEQIEQDLDLERFFHVLTPVGYAAFNRSEGRISQDQQASPKLRARLERMERAFREQLTEDEYLDRLQEEEEQRAFAAAAQAEAETDSHSKKRKANNEVEGEDKEKHKTVSEERMGECPTPPKHQKLPPRSSSLPSRRHAAKYLKEARESIQRKVAYREAARWAKRLRLSQEEKVDYKDW